MSAHPLRPRTATTRGAPPRRNPFVKLERWTEANAKAKEAAWAAGAGERAVTSERDARVALKRAVKAILPARLKVPTRPKGRAPTGGVTRQEVAKLRTKAAGFLGGEEGLQRAEAEVRHTALVILLIDGVLGTEPWRAAKEAHGALISANARLRYLENAARLLDDMRRSQEAVGGGPALLEGVIDAEPTEPTP